MSYDIYLRPPEPKCLACGREHATVYGPEPTYNLTGIFDLALMGEDLPNPEIGEVQVVLFGKETDRPRGLRVLSGRKAGETLLILNLALDRLGDETLREKFRALAPPNGWGTVDTAIEVFQILKRHAEENPEYEWEIR